MARRGYGSDVSIDRYDDRRSHVSKGAGGGRRYEDRVYEEEIDYRSRGPPTREREVRVREEIIERERPRSPPAFLREDYGRTTAGPVVLRKKETEEFDFMPRRRSPSPEPEKKIEREEIIIRRDESESRPPPRRREPSRDREEIIIRRDERGSRDDIRSLPPPRRDDHDTSREEIIIRRDERGSRDDIRSLPPPRRDDHDTSREEIIIRREERDRDRDLRPPPREVEHERDEIIIRRDEGRGRDYDRDDVVSRRGGRGDYERDEIIIRRDERESDDRLPSRADRYALARPVSHERERSRHRGSESEHDQEIIIRRDEREGGRGGDRSREEIIIRNRSRSNSPSSISTRPAPAPEPPIIQAPPIHQEIITHHRHIDHGYELALTRPRPVSRPPSPPMPPPPRERSEERIAIHRSGERNGRTYDEDIVIDRNEGRSRSPLPPPAPRDPHYDYPPPRREPAPPAPAPYRGGGYDRNIEEEAEYYNNHAMERARIGEAYGGATRDWAIVDVPPGTRRVRMNGAGGGEQEITWQRYNGVRRSKFYPDGASDEGYGSEVGRLLPPPETGDRIGNRFGRQKDPREGLWTEITKDLVVKEAIKEMGYEFEETDDFYYVLKYLSYEDMTRLVGLSEDIRKDRRKRVKEMAWENRALPPPIEEPVPRLAIEGPPPRRDERPWHVDDERYIEREVVYRGGRPPPPPGWRR